MESIQHDLAPLYDSLWQEAWPAVRLGQTSCDDRAHRKEQDGRRGMTVIARLAPEVAQRIGAFLEALRTLEPEQYYYPLADLHLTVLSLFTATEQHAPYLAQAGDYLAAVDAAMVNATAFTLETIGITLTSSAVMAQGFPRDAALTELRDRLRASLSGRGLGGGLDQRYRLRTAHNTVVRFTAPLQAPERFADALCAYRDCYFGTSAVTSLDLVINDWYMSSDRLALLKTYPLR